MAGYLIGNGVFDHAEAVPTHAAFAAGHGFLSTAFAKQEKWTFDRAYLRPS